MSQHRRLNVLLVAACVSVTLLLSLPATAQDIEVNSADPSSALQGTTGLTVTVTGNGFGRGAQVDFFLPGTETPGGISVRNVSAKGSKRLEVTIDVAPDATVSSFDIQVAVNGRRGRGTELFNVKPNGGGGGKPGLVECDHDVYPFCLASVGKFHPVPARDYAMTRGGRYTELTSGDFGDILGAMTQGVSANALCDAYDVVVIEWNSPRIKQLSWQRLLDYMACGGGVVFEDPNNVDALAPSVSTIEIRVHSKNQPRTVQLDEACVDAAVPLCGPPLSVGPFEVVNIHIVFDLGGDPGLLPFLRLAEGGEAQVVGLYGQFGTGRIVLTGPDNNFHGDDAITPTDPDDQARMNQYDLVINELDWVLSGP